MASGAARHTGARTPTRLATRTNDMAGFNGLDRAAAAGSGSRGPGGGGGDAVVGGRRVASEVGVEVEAFGFPGTAVA